MKTRKEKTLKETDYMILSAPKDVKFICPYCKEEVQVEFEKLDYLTEVWDDGALVDCPECGKEVKLCGWEYD